MYLFVLLCVQDQYANTFLHDPNITFPVTLHKTVLHWEGGEEEERGVGREGRCWDRGRGGVGEGIEDKDERVWWKKEEDF